MHSVLIECNTHCLKYLFLHYFHVTINNLFLFFGIALLTSTSLLLIILLELTNFSSLTHKIELLRTQILNFFGFSIV